jgi:DNA-binding XRE family transcriptional regulator
MTIQIIKTPAGDDLVILPKSDYERLIALAEDHADAADAREMLRRVQGGEEEVFPGEVAARLIDGENPVKVFREHRRLTQAQLADKVGTNKVYISQIERGERQGSLTLLRKIADALRVDVSDISDVDG